MKIRWWQWRWIDWLPQWLTHLPRWQWPRLDWLPQSLTRQPLLYCIGKVESADEIPEKLPSNTAVAVGALTRPKWIAFDCPCRSGHRIMLNLDRGRSPFWQISGVEGPLSLSPSVNYYDGRRRCHYFIRNGKVDWMKDSFGE
ncbi:DUF6527 family protein [Bradyrhizobium sp.]|uniref:DUF6527 family protein n=1 Tax=Bradyrhizobium sp. TaxID=376 RepID=UPI001D712CC8|nr:DUF6527 family protein [Bradyrhizobium sp.]MBI5323063.1 hypothetical protein [Bradyrhizobium sp.]